MIGSLSAEKEVKVAPSEAWKLYGTLLLAKIVEEAVAGPISKVDVVQGDGGAGTVLEVFFSPGESGDIIKSYKEKFTVIDNDKRVKVAEVVEGGYLDIWFTLYPIRIEVIEKEGKENECVTKATIEYEVKDEVAANLVSIQPFVDIMQIGKDDLLKNSDLPKVL